MQYFTGPTIFRYFAESKWVIYEPNLVESLTGSAVGWAESIISTYLLFIPWYLAYQPLSFGFNKAVIERYISIGTSHAKYGGFCVATWAICCTLRGFGRTQNRIYAQYLDVLEKSSSQKYELKQKWDISFSHWLVDFEAKENKNIVVDLPSAGALAPIAGLIGHTFARWMIYPGATPLLNMLLRPMVEQERKKLIESGAQRAKILSSTKQEIDTLFFDRRLSTQEGETLFITSEGNAGFMEIGSFATVSKSSFSVLGYNHPGFGGSTGTPYPENDAAAVAAVIDYAKHELGFTESQIVVYAWSIGGFDATVAGSAYKELKGLYLDATFDDVMPLADNVMPKALAPITVKTIRSIWNLNNSHYLSKFPGPVTILRRNNDEIMQKNPRIVEDNRANQLLLDFLDVRYPNLMTNQSRSKLKEFLSIGRRDESISWMQSQVDISMARSIIESWQQSKDASTTSLGDDMDDELRLTLLLYLVNKHFVTMDGPHGQPIPIQLLDIPWKMR